MHCCLSGIKTLTLKLQVPSKHGVKVRLLLEPFCVLMRMQWDLRVILLFFYSRQALMENRKSYKATNKCFAVW